MSSETAKSTEGEKVTDGKTAKITEGEKVGRLAAWAWLAIGLAGWLAAWLPAGSLPGRQAGWWLAG